MNTDRPRRLFDNPSRRDCLLAALGGCTLMLTAGCASKEIVTQVSTNLATDTDVNLDANGQASPQTVRLYVLQGGFPVSILQAGPRC